MFPSTSNIMLSCINSSKVYCKSISFDTLYSLCWVLIVAKCIVNVKFVIHQTGEEVVLIVAKCIVNKYLLLENVKNLVY